MAIIAARRTGASGDQSRRHSRTEAIALPRRLPMTWVDDRARGRRMTEEATLAQALVRMLMSVRRSESSGRLLGLSRPAGAGATDLGCL